MENTLYLESGTSYTEHIQSLVTAIILSCITSSKIQTRLFSAQNLQQFDLLKRRITDINGSVAFQKVSELNEVFKDLQGNRRLELDSCIALDTLKEWGESEVIASNIYREMLSQIALASETLCCKKRSLASRKHVTTVLDLSGFGDANEAQLAQLSEYLQLIFQFVRELSSLKLLCIPHLNGPTTFFESEQLVEGSEHQKYSALINADIVLTPVIRDKNAQLIVQEGLNRQLQRANSFGVNRLAPVLQTLSKHAFSDFQDSLVRAMFLDSALRNYRRNRKKIDFFFDEPPIELMPQKTLVIVPYRNRQEHLAVLKEKLNKWGLAMQVVEQGNEEKFNLGILYNIGVALNIDDFDRFVLHCVDNIPDDSLRPYYCAETLDVVHLCNPIVYPKYSCPQFFGGVIALKKELFIAANGFPNNFNGWGGEDVAFYNRVAQLEARVLRPLVGTFEVLSHDEPTIETVDAQRFEKILLDLKNWKQNGMSDLSFAIQSRHQNGLLNHAVVTF